MLGIRELFRASAKGDAARHAKGLLGAILILLILGWSGGAAAQSTDLTVEPRELSFSMVEGDETSLEFDVTFEAEEFYCTEEVRFPFEVRAESIGVAFKAAVGSFNLSVPPGNFFLSSYEESTTLRTWIQVPEGLGNTTDFLHFSVTFYGLEHQACGPEAFPAVTFISPIDLDVEPSMAGVETNEGTDSIPFALLPLVLASGFAALIAHARNP